MKAAGLRCWESFVAKMDPTAHFSSRDAQNFRTRLSLSFQKHLDREHLPIRATTENHFHRLLSSPHFKNTPRRHIRNIPTSGSVSQAKSLSHLQQFANSPLIYFSRRVSAGTATIELAAACLRFEFQNALASSDVKSAEYLKLSGAGSIVLDWLFSSSDWQGFSSLGSTELAKLLMTFIIAEGKEHLIWQWMQELNDMTIRCRFRHHQLAIRKFQRHLLILRFAFEVKYGLGLSSAIDVFSQTVQKISLLAGVDVPGRIIIYLIQKLIRRTELPVIDGHSISTLIRIIDDWDTDPQYRRSLVELYRPEGPDVASALMLLRQYPTDNISTDSARRRQDLVSIGFRLAELLLRDGSDTAIISATWVMGFIQGHFAAEIGLIQPNQQRRADRAAIKKIDEESNLRSLDCLSAV